MSAQYCDVCGMYVESRGDGRVRECGLQSSDASADDDYGYLNDCPFDNDLTIEEYSGHADVYDDDFAYDDIDEEHED